MKKLNRKKLIVALFIFAIVACVATIIVLSVLEIKSHKHDYSAQIIAPTCAEEGYTLHKCACGSSYKSDTVSALGHDYAEEFTVDLQPDCTEKGSKSKHCSRCESTSEVTEIPANGHTFGEWDVVTEGMCTVGQVRSRACGLCGNDELEYSQPLGHVVEYVSEVYYHGGICDRCKNTVQEKHNFKGTVCADCNYEVFPTQGLEYSLNEDKKSYTVTGFGTATDVTDLVIFSTYKVCLLQK
ncbi:MAG: hypothetical protein K2O81_02805 [Clostridia bacterium]|nr:hypothetical protein [Clostridia bacterium]